MHINYPGSRIASEEMVLGPDRKLRYVKDFRIAMYQLLYQRLKHQADKSLIYL